MGNAGPDRGQGGKYLFLPPGPRRRRPRRLLRVPVADLLELGRDPRPRRTRRLADHAHLSAGRRRRPARDRVRRLRRGVVQRHPRQRLQLLRGGQRDRPGGARRRARPRTRRPAGRDRHRPRPTVRTRRPACAASSSKRPGSAPGSPAPCCTSRATPTCTSSTTASWKTAFVGGSYEFLANGARMLDYRAMMHYVGTGITPAMTHAAPGIGSQYAYTVDDANGDDPRRRQELHAHACRRRSPSRRSGRSTSTTPRPAPCCRPTTPTRASTTASATSTPKPTATSSSTSDPNRPTETDVNWLRTIPGKSWFPILRLYGPLEAWFDQDLATRRDPTRITAARARTAASHRRPGRRRSHRTRIYPTDRRSAGSTSEGQGRHRADRLVHASEAITCRTCAGSLSSDHRGPLQSRESRCTERPPR